MGDASQSGLGAVELSLPPLPSEIDASDFTLLDRLARVGARVAQAPWRTFGLEVRLAYVLLENPQARSEIIGVSSGAGPPLHRFFLRPSPEPILLSYWAVWRQRMRRREFMATLASQLAGRRLDYRDGQVMTPPDERGRSFSYRHDPAHWETLEALLALSAPPLEWAYMLHAYACLKHPLEDGNGRLARGLLNLAIGLGLELPGPVLPLGPIFYGCSVELLATLRGLSADGDWPRYFKAMDGLVDRGARAAERLLGAPV